MVCRELTKAHEEIKRGTLAELAGWAAAVSEADPRETPKNKKKGSGAVRGEITLVVAGAARRSRRLLPGVPGRNDLTGPAGPLPPLP